MFTTVDPRVPCLGFALLCIAGCEPRSAPPRPKTAATVLISAVRHQAVTIVPSRAGEQRVVTPGAPHGT